MQKFGEFIKSNPQQIDRPYLYSNSLLANIPSFCKMVADVFGSNHKIGLRICVTQSEGRRVKKKKANHTCSNSLPLIKMHYMVPHLYCVLKWLSGSIKVNFNLI